MFSLPWRLVAIWTLAILERQRQLQAAEEQRRAVINGELAKAGVMHRIALAKDAIKSDAFGAAFNARRDERMAARDENDLRAIAISILIEMGVDLTDVLLRLRRASRTKLKFRAGPTVEAAQRAIDAVATPAAA